MDQTTNAQETTTSQAQQDYAQGKEFLQKKEFAQAAVAFHNALTGFEQDGDEGGVANAADRLGDICLERREFDKALAFFDKAYQICERNFDRFSLFALEKKKAQAYAQAGDYPRAISAYVDIVDEYNALRDPQGAVDALETLAGIYLQVADKEKAADCYRTIASIHKHYRHQNYFTRYMEKAEAVLAD